MGTTLKLTVESAAGTLDIKAQSTIDVALDSNAIEDIKSAILGFHSHSPISELRFKPQGPAGSYSFEYESLDGRIWEQTFNFASPGSPHDPVEYITDIVNWRTTDLIYFRSLRRAISEAYANHAIYDVQVTFTPA